MTDEILQFLGSETEVSRFKDQIFQMEEQKIRVVKNSILPLFLKIINLASNNTGYHREAQTADNAVSIIARNIEGQVAQFARYKKAISRELIAIRGMKAMQSNAAVIQTQIKAIDEIDTLLRQQMIALENLKKALNADEVENIASLLAILERKTDAERVILTQVHDLKVQIPKQNELRNVHAA